MEELLWRPGYRRANASLERPLVYAMGDRGFYAEVTTVARAIIFAWANGRQLRLDSSAFAYAHAQGWGDYFEPFCEEVAEAGQSASPERIEFTRTGDRRPFERLRAFQTDAVTIDGQRLRGFPFIMRHIMRMIHRLNAPTRAAVDAIVGPLGLPSEYVALHMRRGDKVGDEDDHYAAEAYLDLLDPAPDEPIFLMSDEYACLAEVREALLRRGQRNPIHSLCQPEHEGFDVWALRAGERFAGAKAPLEDDRTRTEYLQAETHRMLAEIEIAARAQRFVSTHGSNVGKAVWYLHDRPGDCRYLQRHQASAPRPAPAPRDAGAGYSEASLDALHPLLEKAEVIVEYGAGGSTLLAAQAPGRTVITVDSDRAHLDRMRARAGAEGVRGRIVPLHADLGPVEDWGHPRDRSRWPGFPRYALAPWDHARKMGLWPDLVLIDGRFRLACFLASCVSTLGPLRIVVDDFVGRPNYAAMREVIEPVQIIDERMAIFEVGPGCVRPDFLLRHVAAFFRPHH